MAKKVTSIAPLAYQYIFLSQEEIPDKCNLYPINYKEDELNEYDVLFVHRLLRKNYGDPSAVEFDKTELESILPPGTPYSIEVVGHGRRLITDRILNISHSEIENALLKTELTEWTYYVRNTRNHIFLITTDKLHTKVSIHHVLPSKAIKPNKETKAEGEKFVEALLREAYRQLKGGQLYNIKKEFEDGQNIKFYILHNVYLENYLSALFMLNTSIKGEKEIRDTYLQYDMLSPEVRKSKKKTKNIQNYQSILGLYFASSISFFFMAFEGFINLIYHIFLKDEYRNESEHFNRRLDLEQKLLLMPALCYGFKGELIKSAEFLSIFKELKDFRNTLFHSKISDALSIALFAEQTFLYSQRITKNKDSMFPDHKMHLDIDQVMNFKEKVDLLIEHIKNVMDDKHKKLVEKHLMKSNFISLWKDNDKIRLTKSGK